MVTVCVCVYVMYSDFLHLTISILEDDAHHVSLSQWVLIQQPQWLHLGVHKPALICTVMANALIINT